MVSDTTWPSRADCQKAIEDDIRRGLFGKVVVQRICPEVRITARFRRLDTAAQEAHLRNILEYRIQENSQWTMVILIDDATGHRVGEYSADGGAEAPAIDAVAKTSSAPHDPRVDIVIVRSVLLALPAAHDIESTLQATAKGGERGPTC